MGYYKRFQLSGTENVIYVLIRMMLFECDWSVRRGTKRIGEMTIKLVTKKQTILL